MTRIVIHPGFHKTGTSSVQTMLRDNAGLLAPHLRVYLREDFSALTDAARRYSRTPKPLRLAHFHAAAEAFLATLDPADQRPILMSSEDLSGHLPGRRGLTSYRAAAPLMATLCKAARTRFPDACDLTLYFSTRDPEGWLRSAYWQHLRATRMDLCCADYITRATEAADLDASLKQVAQALGGTTVTSLPLSDLLDLPQGPLTPLLELAQIALKIRAQIQPLAPVNARPAAGLEPVFLALNRSALPNKDVSEIKARLLQMAQRAAPDSQA